MDNRNKALFASLTSFFIILLFFRILSIVDHSSFSLTRIFLHVFVVVILNLRNRVTWALGLVFFFYGLFYYLFISGRIPYPSEVVFTLPIVEFFFGDKHGFSNTGIIVPLLLWVPPFFYVGMIAWFFTKKIRTIYSSIDIFSSKS